MQTKTDMWKYCSNYKLSSRWICGLRQQLRSFKQFIVYFKYLFFHVVIANWNRHTFVFLKCRRFSGERAYFRIFEMSTFFWRKSKNMVKLVLLQTRWHNNLTCLFLAYLSFKKYTKVFGIVGAIVDKLTDCYKFNCFINVIFLTFLSIFLKWLMTCFSKVSLAWHRLLW